MSKLRAVTYSRVSTTHHGQNPAAQAEELRRYCEARGWVVEHELVDHGFSGSTADRPALKQLMSLTRRRKVDVVVIYKMDRLFRSLKNLVSTLDEFQTLGVLFVATNDQIDFTSAHGRLLTHILASLSEFEKALLIERTMLGLAHARSKGKILGRPQVRDDEPILALRADGLSYRKIAAKLNISQGAVYRALKSATKTPQETGVKSE